MVQGGGGNRSERLGVEMSTFDYDGGAGGRTKDRALEGAHV